MRKSWFVSLLVCLVPATSWSQEEPVPPPVPWYIIDTFPADGMEDAPLNGVEAVRLGFGLSSQWPPDELVSDTVALRLTRAQDEEVEGVMTIEPDLGEVRYETTFPLAEGIEYTLHIELKNSRFEVPGEDETYEVRFTTADRFDEAPPAFSGLQSLGVTEYAEAVRACCPARDDFCVGRPTDLCEWCWIVDWEYRPQIDLSFRAVDDEFGPESIAYLIYRVEGPDAAPEGPPQIVERYGQAGDQVLHLVTQDDGPWCYHVRAVDVWGRDDGNSTALCGDATDLVPIDRLEVPPEDRSNCADQGADPDADVGGDAPDAGANDVADETPEAGMADAAEQVAARPDDEGCGCHTAPPSAPFRWLLRR